MKLVIQKHEADQLIVMFEYLLSEKIEVFYSKKSSDSYIKETGLFSWRKFLGTRVDN